MVLNRRKWNKQRDIRNNKKASFGGSKTATGKRMDWVSHGQTKHNES